MTKYIAGNKDDSEHLRKKFLDECNKLSNIISELREKKMHVYGMNWMKRGWDGIFQNLDRKFGVIEENLWNKIILKREKPTIDELSHLLDGLIDLSNYCQMTVFFAMIEFEAEWPEIKNEIIKKMEVDIKEKFDE